MANKPPLPFPVQHGATTVGPSYAQTISTSLRLIQITEFVVLTRENGIEYARLFRESTAAPGYRSCDRYERRDGGPWKLISKDSRKYEPGDGLPNAYHAVIEGMSFHTLHAMTAEEIADHRVNLRRLLVRP